MVVKLFLRDIVFHADKLYDYLVPSQLEPKIKKGIRVLVPFGKGNSKKEGVVVAVLDKSEVDFPLKPVKAVLDDRFPISDELLSLCAFMKERYFCTYYEAAKVILCPGSSLRLEEYLSFNTKCPIEIVENYKSKKSYFEIVRFFENHKGFISRNELLIKFEKKTRQINELLKKGVLLSEMRHFAGIRDKFQKSVRLCGKQQDTMEKMPTGLEKKRQMLISLLEENESLSLKEASVLTKLSIGAIETLHKQKIVEIFSREVFRDKMELSEIKKAPILTEDQKKAFDGLKELLNKNKPYTALLKGVTGSGKTLVFLALIDEVLKKGREALVLVPEIALTPQMVNRFCERFGEKVAVLHSAMSLGERYDAWKRIESGNAKIVVGTRSAVFAPLNNIGIIVIDEEQESAYKSEMNPRYCAREAAHFRSLKNNALLLFSSATPSIETNYKAQTGGYAFYELPSRFNSHSLPQVKIEDMGKQQREGNFSFISDSMLFELKKNLENNEQSILFINRRGHSPVVACKSCREIAMCPNCSISLTYHADNNSLICHYCGYTHSKDMKCSKCKGKYSELSGIGTQKVEEEIGRLLPNAKVLRMDADTTAVKGGHESILSQFGNKEADILIGTQMVTKGLDFENVTFVGILSVDSSLYLNDYRAAENTFSMLTQVIGRCGRGEKPGRAILQTFSPQNSVLMYSVSQNYDAFYNEEVKIRKELKYPPFGDICVFTLSGVIAEQTGEVANRLCDLAREGINQFSKYIDASVLGVSPAPIYKVAGRYRWRVIIKCRNDRAFRTLVNKIMQGFYAVRSYKAITLSVDINPQSFM